MKYEYKQYHKQKTLNFPYISSFFLTYWYLVAFKILKPFGTELFIIHLLNVYQMLSSLGKIFDLPIGISQPDLDYYCIPLMD